MDKGFVREPRFPLLSILLVSKGRPWFPTPHLPPSRLGDLDLDLRSNPLSLSKRSNTR